MAHGGKRNGAGRKKSSNKKKIYTTRLYPDKINFLRSLRNAAKFLDEAIDEKRDNDNNN